MKKPVIFLFGGIGNQLFQIAHALHCHNFMASDFIICDDFTKSFSTFRTPIFELFPALNIKLDRLNFKSIKLMTFFGIHPRLQIKILSLLHRRKIVNDRNLHDFNMLDNFPCPSFHYGYFQYDRGHFLDSIKYLGLECQQHNDRYVLRDENECAVHIRRGDFLSSKSHTPIPLSYYIDSVRLYNDSGVSRYFLYGVGCEDILDELIDNFPTAKFTIMKGLPEDELLQITYFQNHIGSNSTFSLWTLFIALSYSMRINTPLKITVPKEVASFFSFAHVRAL